MFVMLTITCRVLNLTGGASFVRGASCDLSQASVILNQSWGVTLFNSVSLALMLVNMCSGQQHFLLFVTGQENKLNQCLKWLDLQGPNSVVYASLGSICGLTSSQLVELGLGLESSNRPFIWVMRGGEKSRELEKWIEEERFEQRIQGRGFLIKGWSPQILVLCHPSVGAFLTHCGWNSTLEGCCSGLPIITCPLFAEQFINEKLITQVLGTGVCVGVKAAVTWEMEEKSGLVMKRRDIKNAIENIFDEGVEGEDRRRMAKEIAKMAKRALEEGGSSYINIGALIQDIMQQSLSSVEASS